MGGGRDVTISSGEIQYECWVFIPSINILVIKRTTYLLFDRLYNCVLLIFMCYIDVVYLIHGKLIIALNDTSI